MGFRVLPPRIIQRLTHGIRDELTPAAEKRSLAISNTPCPRCGSAMEPYIHAPHAFTGEEMLPRTMARCPECTSVIDPQTGLVLDVGDPRLVGEALPLVRPTDD